MHSPVAPPGSERLNDVSNSCEPMRHGSAVYDEWKRNGFMVAGTRAPGPPATDAQQKRAAPAVG
jgi:hypothetical protein